MPARRTQRKSSSARRTEDRVGAYARAVLAGRIIAGPHVRNACRRHLDDRRLGAGRGLIWDLKASDRAIRFFETVLRLNSGQFEGEPFKLEPSQAFIVGSIFGWKRTTDKSRRFRRAYLEEGKGNGKPIFVGTPIPTPSGWSTMGELRVGDRVFDEQGAPRVVVAASDVMLNRECYRMRFSDGGEIIAEAGHQWVTARLRTGGRRGDKIRGVPRSQWKRSAKGAEGLRTTAEIARTLVVPKGSGAHPQAKWNHRIEVARSLQLPAASLPIPPYTLGAWLGDGDSAGGRITAAFADRAVIDQVAADGFGVVERKPQRPSTGRFRITGLTARLRALGVLHNKHVPARYLRGSHAQRLALLQGLADTDGFVSKGQAQCEITTISARLRDDIIELVRTLGLKPSYSTVRAKVNGKDCGEAFRIQFHAGDVPVFRLPRKLARLKPSPAGRRALSRGRMIVACDPIPSVPVRCIQVDGPSHLFLAGTSMVATHNSPLQAGIGLYCMLSDGEPRAEVYAAASKKDQAMVLFRDAVAMRDQSPALQSRLLKSGANPVWQMTDPRSGSTFKPISSDDGQSGPRPSCALCDEIHEHKDGGAIIDMLERGFKFRRQPLLVMATNSGSDRNTVCWQEHQHAVRVAAGTMAPDDEFTYVGEPIDDETFSYVCGLDKDEDFLEDPKCWIKANPLLGVIVREETIASAVKQAKLIPGKANGVLRLHGCVWTDADTAWMSRKALERVLFDFDPAIHVGKELCASADLSGVQDLTATGFCVQTGTVTRERDGKPIELPTFDAWVEVWTPRDTLAERALKDQAPYEVWVKGGWLNAIEGKTIRLDFVAARLAEVSIEYLIRLLAYDRYAYRKLEDELDKLGITIPQVEHPQGGVRRAKPPQEWIDAAKANSQEPPQGLWMPGSVVALETLILEERIRIRRSPVVISAMMSAVVEHDPFDNRWFSKRRAVNRIDALVALTMAVGAATGAPSSGPGSVYEERGLLIIGT